MSQDYIVSARKYRPSTFQSVVGQKALVQTLKNAIAADKLAHAYLFCGPRGVGKTSCARIFAKTINCQYPTAEGDACNDCESCRAFNEQRSLNIHELDAASNNSVDNIRDLIEQVHVPPQIGKYKVFIIDEVHMLSTAAFNAFLKTLEEPPAHAIFILATTEKQKILPTILSRCQTYDFQRISVQDIADHLQYVASQEGISVEPQALQVIARKADGGMRDALSVFDQIASFTAGHVTYQAAIENLGLLDYELFFRMTDAALQGNVPAALVMLDQVMRRGFDPQLFIGGWAGHLRDLMMSKDAATLALVEAGQDVAMRYQQQAAQCSLPFLYTALQIANDCDFNYRNSRNKRLSVEVAIIKICQLSQPQPVLTQPQPQMAAAPAAPVQAQPQPQPQRPVQQAPVQTAPQPQPQPQRPAPAYAAQPQPQPQPTVVREPQPAYPQPAAAPQGGAPTSRFAPRGGTGRIAGTRTTSMHASVGSAAGPAGANPAQQMEEQNEPVDDSALRRTWKEFVSTIPTENFVAHTMLSCIPQRIEGVHYQVTVLNQEQRDRLAARHEAILRYLRTHLHNTHLTFDIVQADLSTQHQAFTPREKFQEMRADNEALQQMVDAFGLEFV
jgi:DNA polymerase-3 subunit gamma/tau